MAGNPRADKEARATRQRLRAYQARQKVHEHRIRRRVRDNVGAAIAVVVVLLIAVGAQLAYFNVGPGTPPAATPTASETPTPTPTPTAGANQGDVPPATLAEGRTWTGSMKLNDATLQFELDGAAAPQGVSSMISLIKSGFYNGLSCHRLTTAEGFRVLQCGDPSGDGSGGPGYSYGPVENAPADNVYPAGTIAMARQSGNGYSNGSQFFIVYGDTTIPADAAGGYTVLGRVTAGLDGLSPITSAGVAGGKNDGAPVVPVTLSDLSVQ